MQGGFLPLHSWAFVPVSTKSRSFRWVLWTKSYGTCPQCRSQRALKKLSKFGAEKVVQMNWSWKLKKLSKIFAVRSLQNPLAKHIEAFKIARSSSSKWILPFYAEWDHSTQITEGNLENDEIKGGFPLYKLLLEIRHLHIPKNSRRPFWSCF